MSENSAPNPAEEHGFDLKSVSWGYRRVFLEAIRGLLDEGALGPHRREATETFFELLKLSRPGSFDFALKEFLGALNARTKWLLELPGLFEDFCRLGRELAAERLAHGISFFRLWGAGGFGATPEQITELLRHVRTLRAVDAELAQAFTVGYGQLIEQLTAGQMNLFVNELVSLHARSRATAIDFAALRLKSAAAFVRNLTQEARLAEVAGRLARLARAISGRAMEVADLSALDSDALIERNSTVVCLRDHLYLPSRIRCCAALRENEALYLLATVMASAAVAGRSFAAIHGQAGRPDLAEWLGGDARHAALVAIIETVRIVQDVRRRMPGARRLADFGIEREFSLAPPRTATDELLWQCLRGGEAPGGELAGDIRAAARASGNIRESIRRSEALLEAFARVGDAPPRALMFFPDFYYPGVLQPAPASTLVADLARRRRPDQKATELEQEAATRQRRGEPAEGEAEAAVPAAFVYPEWNQSENDYYHDWCHLREHVGRFEEHAGVDAEADEHAARARRMFERLKPDLARKEKFLDHGDEINIDLLVEYLALRRAVPGPRVRFYEKSFIKRRDLAVALLLDVSGSTAGMPQGAPPAGDRAGRRIIDLEKRAASTLSEGLDALGDDFGVYGFSGNGRESCDFFIYKDLDEPFGPDARRRLGAAYPTASTRIGVAVRHCHAKLARHPARRKLIILITDGKPQDSGYDPASRYAQYDVRMACLECARDGVHVVCISTLENARSDLEIMFPHRSFVILEDMTRLADVLPMLYLKMTA